MLPSPPAGACQTLPLAPLGPLPAYPPAHQDLQEGPRRSWQGWDQAWIPGGRLAPLCLAMPPCRDLCNVGIGIDYGDCVVAAGPEVSRGRGCLSVHTRTYVLQICTYRTYRTHRTSVPLCFETNSEAAVRAPTSGMPDGGCGWLPSCPSTHINRRPCRSPPTSAKTVAKGEATSISHRAARCLD